MLLDLIQALVYLEQILRTEFLVCHLTEIELRQLFRRFRHPLVARLKTMLERAGKNINHGLLEKITKFCHYCQKYRRSPGRFKWAIKDDDTEFNFRVYIDAMFLDSKPVLQVVDEATAFQAAKFLKSMSAADAWNALRSCWIDVYLGPPAYIVHDPGTNFDSKEFKDNAKMMASETKTMPVEAHHSIGLVERYHVPLRRAYNILTKELPDVLKEDRL